jgi:hypothetical protein
MTHYIAELDDAQKIAAVWVKEKATRGPSVFDPKKHMFDTAPDNKFSGASKKDIENWIADA